MDKNIRLSIYGNIARAFSVNAKPGEIKAEPTEIVLSPQAAKMMYIDLKMVIQGKKKNNSA